MTNRVYLRPFKLADAPTLYKWGQDKYYQHFAGFGYYKNMAQAETAAAQYASRKYSYAVCLKNNDQIIGLVEMYERGTSETELLTSKEIGFLMDKAQSGHGYMTEALTLLLNYAFTELKQTEIWAGTFKDNFRSQKLLMSLGFKYIYSVDMSKISNLFSYEEKYFVLKKAKWLDKIERTF